LAGLEVTTEGKDQRTFAQNLLHVAAINYFLIGKVSGTKSRTGFRKGF
jgi:hypothetical protein